MTNYDPRVSAPPPLPAPTLAGAVFGPILLLTIGVLFAIDYAGGPAVSRTWPVLIIEAGLLKLGEFMAHRGSLRGGSQL